MIHYNNLLLRSCIHWHGSTTPSYCDHNPVGERQGPLREDYWKYNFLGIFCLDRTTVSSIIVLFRLAGEIRK